MLDGRRSQFIRWSDEKSHRGSISDIIKLGERVVSCDVHGNIFSWKLSEWFYTIFDIVYEIWKSLFGWWKRGNIIQSDTSADISLISWAEK